MNDLHERVMNLTAESVRLRRRLAPHPAECPVNDDGQHDTYGGICYCGWSMNRPDVAGRAVEPDRQELSVMLADIEAAALTGDQLCGCTIHEDRGEPCPNAVRICLSCERDCWGTTCQHAVVDQNPEDLSYGTCLFCGTTVARDGPANLWVAATDETIEEEHLHDLDDSGTCRFRHVVTIP